MKTILSFTAGGIRRTLLHKELEDLRISGPVLPRHQPWYYRQEDSDTGLKSVTPTALMIISLDTTTMGNGQYEVNGIDACLCEEKQ